VERSEAVEPSKLESVVQESGEFDRIWNEEWHSHALRVAEDHVKRTVKPVQFQAFQLHVANGVAASEVARRLGIKLMEVYWAKYRVGQMLKTAILEAENS
jgi:RNA polymerase sigma-70 factor (ECF subfamily)